MVAGGHNVIDHFAPNFAHKGLFHEVQMCNFPFRNFSKSPIGWGIVEIVVRIDIFYLFSPLQKAVFGFLGIYEAQF